MESRQASDGESICREDHRGNDPLFDMAFYLPGTDSRTDSEDQSIKSHSSTVGAASFLVGIGMGWSDQEPEKEGREDETGIMAVLPCELILYILLCVDSHQTLCSCASTSRSWHELCTVQPFRDLVWSSQLEKRTWKNTVYFRGMMGREEGPASSSSPCDTDARSLYVWRHKDEANMDRRIVEMLDQSSKSLATLKDAIARQRNDQEERLQEKLRERRIAKARRREAKQQQQQQQQQLEEGLLIAETAQVEGEDLEVQVAARGGDGGGR